MGAVCISDQGMNRYKVRKDAAFKLNFPELGLVSLGQPREMHRKVGFDDDRHTCGTAKLFH